MMKCRKLRGEGLSPSRRSEGDGSSGNVPKVAKYVVVQQDAVRLWLGRLDLTAARPSRRKAQLGQGRTRVGLDESLALVRI